MSAMENVGRYRLTRRIGAGSFATVWLAHDDDLDVPVAVKILAENWAQNDDIRQRFLAEARMMRRIKSERVVKVYDIGNLADGRPYFVMDYADGGSLNDRRHAGIPPADGLRLCGEACQALQVLHDRYLVHRDVTPGNMLLTHGQHEELTVVVVDLGVAQSTISESGSTMTAGTPAYMAPEQAGSSNGLSTLADVYSLAAMTYAVLTGDPPFGVTSVADVLTRDPSQRPAPVAEELGTPSELDQIMATALSADPADRPSSASALGAAFDQVAEAMESGAAEAGTVVRSPQPTGSSPSSPVGQAPIRPHQRRPGNSDVGYGPVADAPAGRAETVEPSGMPSPSTRPGPERPAGQPAQLSGAGHPLSFQRPGTGPDISHQPPAQQPMAHPQQADASTVPNTAGPRTMFYVFIGVAAAAVFAVAMLATMLIVR